MNNGLERAFPSNNQVRKAGRTLRLMLKLQAPFDPEAFNDAITVIERHRAAHNAPVNSANVALRGMCERLGLPPRVTQRLKKMQTIQEKLFREPGMELDRMRDIGGCRVIVPTIDDAYRLARRVMRDDAKLIDYIERPRRSGYRALHIERKYGGNPRKTVEVQIRTEIMHDWAEMVEDISGKLGINYKTDGESVFHQWAKTASDLMALQESGEVVSDSLASAYTELLAQVLQFDLGEEDHGNE